MSGHERYQPARLDAGIDALLAGTAPDAEHDADGLLATARLLRALPPEPAWPDADFPTRLATQLVAALQPAVSVRPALVTPNGAEASARAVSAGPLRLPAAGRRWWRQVAQLAAALAAFGLVALVLVLVFRGSGETSPNVAVAPSSSPVSASPTSAPTTIALPTPDGSGIVRMATFAEAQALAAFPLVMPAPLPDGMTFGGATAQYDPQPGAHSTPGTMIWSGVREVTLFFNASTGDPNARPPGIQFLQSTLRNEVAVDEHTTVTQTTLGGKQVTQTLLKRDAGGDVLTYSWNTASVSYTVVTVLRDGMMEEMAAALVAATPLPEGATIVPPDAQGSPTPATPTVTVEPSTPTTSGQPYHEVSAWDAQLQTAGSIVVGPDGSVYLIDSTHGYVRVFAPDGSLTREWDLPPGEFNGGPNDIALGPDGDIYALDGGDALVLKYDPSGNLITSWGGHAPEEDHMQLGKFVSPFDIAVSDDGLVYVSELTFNGIPRVQRFTTAGQFVDEWLKTAGTLPSAGAQHIQVVGSRVYVGHWIGGAVFPSITEFDPDHNVIATPVDANSTALSALGVRITSFAVDAAGNMYLADANHTQVIKLGPDGSVLATWLIEGVARDAGEGFIVAVDDIGRIYTVDSLSRQIKVFAPAEPPSLSLNPNSGTCTSQFGVIVERFAPNSLVTISVGAADGSGFTDLMTLPTDADGTESLSRSGLNDLVGCVDDALPGEGAQFTVRATPFDPKGTGNASAGASASATFTYLGETPALLTLTPSVGACDTPVVASGADFTHGTTLAIYANLIGGHEPSLAANVTVADDGTFSVALDVTSMLGCGPGFNPDAVFVVWAGPDAGKLGNEIPGRTAGTLFFAARDVPVAVATRDTLPFCGADPEVARQFVDPTDAPLICLRDAAARGASGEMATGAVTRDGETIKLFRASHGMIEVISATRAATALQYAWTRQTCSSVEVSVQPISVGGCSAVEQLPLAR